MKMKNYLLAIVALVVSLSASAQSNNSFAQEYMSLSGYLQGGFQSTDFLSTFYLKRARVSLTGNAKQEKIDYRLQVDMAGEPKICDLYFRYKPSSKLGMQLGQFKIPFAIENDIYGPTTVELIDYSYITMLLARNQNRYDGLAVTGRDIGFQLYGALAEAKGYNILSYNVGVFNGAGINTQDNNDAKDYVARLIYKPSKALSLSGSIMSTQTTKEESRLILEGLNVVTATKKTNIKSSRWALGAIYDVDEFILRSEYAGATFDTFDVESFYVLGGYKIKRDWMLVARYEVLNQIYKTHTWQADRVTVGAVFKPYSFLRFQLNYAYEQGGDKGAKRPDKNGYLNLMLTAIF